jgi:hypothetical protein
MGATAMDTPRIAGDGSPEAANDGVHRDTVLLGDLQNVNKPPRHVLGPSLQLVLHPRTNYYVRIGAQRKRQRFVRVSAAATRNQARPCGVAP